MHHLSDSSSLTDRGLDHLKVRREIGGPLVEDPPSRLAGEVGYAEALAEVLIAAADLCGPGYRVRYAIRELVRAYIALQRIFSPPVRPWEATPTPDI